MELKHPSIVASVGAGAVLAAASTVVAVPWLLWVAWAVLAAVSLAQARRGHA